MGQTFGIKKRKVFIYYFINLSKMNPTTGYLIAKGEASKFQKVAVYFRQIS